MEQMNTPAPFSRLALRLHEAREQERERMARDIHDVLGATLAALKFETHLTCKALDQRLAHAPDVEIARILQRTRQINTLLDEAISASRDLVRDHHPRVLRERGLVAAVEAHAAAFARRSGVKVSVSSSGAGLEVAPEVAIALYRVFQEALTNVLRHAKATRVLARLRLTENDTSLEIRDDGVGIASSDASPVSYGLSNMRERVHAVGGHLKIKTSPGAGTTLILRVPMGALTNEPAWVRMS